MILRRPVATNNFSNRAVVNRLAQLEARIDPILFAREEDDDSHVLRNTGIGAGALGVGGVGYVGHRRIMDRVAGLRSTQEGFAQRGRFSQYGTAAKSLGNDVLTSAREGAANATSATVNAAKAAGNATVNAAVGTKDAVAGAGNALFGAEARAALAAKARRGAGWLSGAVKGAAKAAHILSAQERVVLLAQGIRAQELNELARYDERENDGRYEGGHLVRNTVVGGTGVAGLGLGGAYLHGRISDRASGMRITEPGFAGMTKGQQYRTAAKGLGRDAYQGVKGGATYVGSKVAGAGRAAGGAVASTPSMVSGAFKATKEALGRRVTAIQAARFFRK